MIVDTFVVKIKRGCVKLKSCQLSRRTGARDLSRHSEGCVIIHDDFGQTVTAIYTPPGWAGGVGWDQRGLNVAAPGTVPNRIADGHVLGIGEHRRFGKDGREIFVHPGTAAISAVMIGQ